MRGPTDGTLLGQAIDGDRTGFMRLVDRYAPLVSAVVQHRLGERSAAGEKIVEETFREAFLEIRRLSDRESFYKRLMEIARDKLEAHGAAAHAETEMANAALDESQQLARIVRWKYLEGRSYEDIARRLGIPADRVHPLIEKGRIHSRWSHWREQREEEFS